MSCRRIVVLLAALLSLTVGRPAFATRPSGPLGPVVGNGTDVSCTEAALAQALALGGTITFACGPAPVAIILTSIKQITTTATLEGAGLITLSGGNTTPLLYVHSGRVLTLSNLTVTRGYNAGGDGGAIRNDGTLHVTHTTFRGNHTSMDYSGGAIVTYGPLTIDHSLFENNSGGGAGAVYPRWGSVVTITASLFERNYTKSASAGYGGALLLWDGPQVTVSNSQFISNTAVWGGAIYVTANSSLTMTASLVSENAAASGGSSDGGGGGLYNSGRLVLFDSQVTGNWVAVPPGYVVPGVRAGGGIFNAQDAILRLTGGSLAGNRSRKGGGLYAIGHSWLYSATVSNNVAGEGGGLYVGAASQVFIAGSTLSGNAVSFAEVPSVTTPAGAAIYNLGKLDVINSTLSGNAGQRAIGELNSTITLTNTTIARNALGGLTSLQSPNSSVVRLRNTLLADNTTANCGIGFNTFVSENGLSSDASCAWTVGPNQNNAVPLLSLLENYGGPTKTHLYPAGSPAEDAGAACPPTDQRGVARPMGAACDIGAVERRPFDPFQLVRLPLALR